MGVTGSGNGGAGGIFDDGDHPLGSSVLGGLGDDTLEGTFRGRNTVLAGPGDDFIGGIVPSGVGAPVIYGGAGNDTIDASG